MFTCFNCGEVWSDELHRAGKRRKRCLPCEYWRGEKKKPYQALTEARYRVESVKRFYNKALKDRGLCRCIKCQVVFSPTETLAKSKRKRCQSCFEAFQKARDRGAAARLSECSEETRLGIEKHGSMEALRKARALQAEARKADKLARKNAIQAFQYHLRVKASDEWVKGYYESLGQPWRNPRLSEAEAYRIRYWRDPQFNVLERMRNQTRKAIRKDGIADVMRSAINREGTSPSTEKLLGYTIKELTAHLERQFTKGMSWELFRSGQIHIDHIIPKACFDFTKEGEWEACWALSNLRPCWDGENISKSAKRLHLI